MWLEGKSLSVKKTNSSKYLTNKAVRVGVGQKQSVSPIVLIRLMVLNVLLLVRNREYPASRAKKQSRDFRTITKIFKGPDWCQTNLGHCLPPEDGFLNIPAKALIPAFNHRGKVEFHPVKFPGLLNRDPVLVLRHRELAVIPPDQDPLGRHRNVLPLFNRAILSEQRQFVMSLPKSIHFQHFKSVLQCPILSVQLANIENHLEIRMDAGLTDNVCPRLRILRVLIRLIPIRQGRLFPHQAIQFWTVKKTVVLGTWQLNTADFQVQPTHFIQPEASPNVLTV